MKKIVHKTPAAAPPLWHFFKKHLPPSLTTTFWEGYGVHFTVSADNSTIAYISRVWPWDWVLGYRATVELLHPQYYADFEDIIRKFEALGKGKVRFIHWEQE